jgi:hypothetical protein
VVCWDEVQRGKRTVRWPAERFAPRRLSVSAFVRLVARARAFRINVCSERKRKENTMVGGE